MMRVLYIAPTEVRRSGIADYAAAFREAMSRESDVALEMLADLPGHAFPSDRDVRLSDAPGRTSRAIDAGALERFDLVHVELGTELYPEFFVAYEIVKRLRLPLVVTVHDAPYTVKNLQPFWDLAPYSSLPMRVIRKALNVTVGKWYERKLLRRTDVALVLSERAGRALQRRLRPRRIEVLPHLVLHDDLVAERAEPDGTTPLMVLFFGFLYPPKGVHDLIDAIALVAQDPALRARIRLSICGGTLNDDAADPYRARLERMVIERDLGDIVSFEGFVPQARVQELLNTHGVIVLPYLEAKELSTSGPLIQAMSHGLVPIVTPARAMSEIVRDGENGFVVPPGDADAIARRLRQLLAAPSVLAALGNRAQSSVRVNHGWKSVADRVTGIYDSLR